MGLFGSTPKCRGNEIESFRLCAGLLDHMVARGVPDAIYA